MVGFTWPSKRFYWKSQFWKRRLHMKRHISSNKSLIPAPKSDGSRNKNKLKIEVYIKSIKKTAYKWPIGPRLRSSFFSLNVWLDQTFNEIRKISRFLAPDSHPLRLMVPYSRGFVTRSNSSVIRYIFSTFFPCTKFQLKFYTVWWYKYMYCYSINQSCLQETDSFVWTWTGRIWKFVVAMYFAAVIVRKDWTSNFDTVPSTIC